MNVPKEYDDIRPYNPEELPKVFDELESDPQFRSVMAQVMPDVPFEAVMAKARKCKNLLDFQLAFSYDIMQAIMDRHTSGTTMNVGDLDKTKNYTFVSNHRDIVLDSAFLSKLLVDNGFTNTAEIAIGDNLLILPWIRRVVRLNKSFIVKRGRHGREKLLASQQLSGYMHFAIQEKKENIWIAQREGRAKDSNDHTQEAILKMMRLGGEGTVIERLQELHIVPLSISYEYDPCDYLKAKEFQQKRDDADYKKSPKDDLLSMKTGILGFKGHVHYQAAACIDPWLGTLDATKHKVELYPVIAAHIDREIHSNYHLYANNYVAYDALLETDRFASLYTPEEADHFDTYIKGQIEKIDLPSPDYDYLKRMLLTMYANPLINYLKAAEK